MQEASRRDERLTTGLMQRLPAPVGSSRTVACLEVDQAHLDQIAGSLWHRSRTLPSIVGNCRNGTFPLEVQFAQHALQPTPAAGAVADPARDTLAAPLKVNAEGLDTAEGDPRVRLRFPDREV